MTKREYWKDIPKYEGYYQASNFGRIRSLDRVVTNKNGVKSRLKSKVKLQSIAKNGYYIVGLCKECKAISFAVHQLIAITFLNHTPCGQGLVVDHIDHDKLNNNLDNLQVIPQSQNCKRAIRPNKTSQYLGVCWDKYCKRWLTTIWINGRQKRIGRYKTENEAYEAYKTAEAQQ